MKFNEWLNEQCVKRAKVIAESGKAPILNMKIDMLKFNNGKSMSVQASPYHKCYPQEMLDTNEYETVEIYTSDDDLMTDLVFYEVSECTYGNVPISLVEEICEKNGGIAND